MFNANYKLIQTISARIFHDLAGPIGAINNCLELLDNDNKEIKKEVNTLVYKNPQALLIILNYSVLFLDFLILIIK